MSMSNLRPYCLLLAGLLSVTCRRAEDPPRLFERLAARSRGGLPEQWHACMMGAHRASVGNSERATSSASTPTWATITARARASRRRGATRAAVRRTTPEHQA